MTTELVEAYDEQRTAYDLLIANRRDLAVARKLMREYESTKIKIGPIETPRMNMTSFVIYTAHPSSFMFKGNCYTFSEMRHEIHNIKRRIKSCDRDYTKAWRKCRDLCKEQGVSHNNGLIFSTKLDELISLKSAAESWKSKWHAAQARYNERLKDC